MCVHATLRLLFEVSIESNVVFMSANDDAAVSKLLFACVRTLQFEVRPWHENGHAVEIIVQLFKRDATRLGQERPEEERVREAADREHKIELPTDTRKCQRADLGYHEVGYPGRR